MFHVQIRLVKSFQLHQSILLSLQYFALGFDSGGGASQRFNGNRDLVIQDRTDRLALAFILMQLTLLFQ